LFFGREAAAVVVYRLGVIALRVVGVCDAVQRITDAAPVSRRFILAHGFVVKPDRGLVISLFVLGLRDLEQASGVVRFRFNPFQTSPIKVGGERVIALFVMDGADIFQRLRRLSLLVQLFVNRQSALKVFNRLLRIAEGGLGEADAGQEARRFRLASEL